MNFPILLLSPLGKGLGPSFEQTLIPITLDAFCQVWLKLTMQVVLKRRKKCEKFTDRRTTGDQKSSLELSTQVR